MEHLPLDLPDMRGCGAFNSPLGPFILHCGTELRPRTVCPQHPTGVQLRRHSPKPGVSLDDCRARCGGSTCHVERRFHTSRHKILGKWQESARFT